jgi:hypothetical protein
MQPLTTPGARPPAAAKGGRDAVCWRRLLAAALPAAVLLLAAPAPARAGYGAVAYDETTGKYGARWDAPTPARANELALRECASRHCRVHPVEPKGCGALALSEKDKDGHIYWGGGSCAVRLSGCNR